MRFNYSGMLVDKTIYWKCTVKSANHNNKNHHENLIIYAN